MNKNVIVTGASGFVGMHVVSKLIEDGHDVISLVRNVEKAKNIDQLKSSKIIEFDISSNSKIFFADKDSYLIHCAWDHVRDNLNFIHLEQHFGVHLMFLKKLVDIGIQKIIVTGSCYEYGLQYGPVDEKELTKPNTPYAIAKDTLHKSLSFLTQDKKTDLLWCRLFYNYGYGQDPKSIISLFDKAIQRGDKHFNMSFGEQLLDYLSVSETATQLVSLLKEDRGVFNICSGKPISLRRFLEKRMQEKKKFIKLKLGHFPYRKQDSIAIWGKNSFDSQIKHKESNKAYGL